MKLIFMDADIQDTVERLQREKRKFNPECLIYALYQDEELVYIGQTKGNLHGRLYAHTKDKKFNLYTTATCEEDELNDMEASLIVMLKPKYNTAIPKNDRFLTLRQIQAKIGQSYMRVKKHVQLNDIKPSYFNVYDLFSFDEIDKNIHLR